MLELRCIYFRLLCPVRLSYKRLTMRNDFYYYTGLLHKNMYKTFHDYNYNQAYRIRTLSPNYFSSGKMKKRTLLKNWVCPFLARSICTCVQSLKCQNVNESETSKDGVPVSRFETFGHQLERREKFWEHKQHFIKDIKETKAKAKEKVGEIIERENIWTIPNILCMSRIGISPFLCFAVGGGYYSVALGLFIFAGFTDLIDGMIARSFPGQATRLGSFLDPLADKVLIASLFLSLTYVGLIPVQLAGLIIYRDFLIIAAACYIRYKSVSNPITLSKYFDATQVTAQLSPTLVSKFNTAVQLCLIAASLAAPVFMFTDHYLLHTFRWFTAGTTIASGISYIFSKDTYKILSKNDYGNFKTD